MPASDDTFECDSCESVVLAADARRTKTIGNLDPTAWQTLCCPECGDRLKTVFVGDES